MGGELMQGAMDGPGFLDVLMRSVNQPSPVATVAHIIQLAVAPVFLLTGIGSLLNVFAGRLSRVIDRARKLEAEIPGLSERDRELALAELVILDQRMAVIHWAINGVVAGALFVCVVVALLFVADLVSLEFGRPVAIMFITAMVLLIAGLVLFMIEVSIATRSVRVREEYVRRREWWRLSRQERGDLGRPSRPKN